MTLFLSFRSQAVGGPVQDPQLLEGNGWDASPSLKIASPGTVASRIEGRTIVFVAHGFNVNMGRGCRSFAQFEAALNLPPSHVFVGLLWPGDFAIKFINYPVESATANDCGERLAIYCKRVFSSAADYIFFSHSLGARLVLKAVESLHKRARAICLTAGAVDRDSLINEFPAATDNVESIHILSSRKDSVLKLAYPAGDFVADLLDGDSNLFRAALGYKGPASPVPGAVIPYWAIDKSANFGHGDYLPNDEFSTATVPPLPAKQKKVLRFFQEAIAETGHQWP